MRRIISIFIFLSISFNTFAQKRQYSFKPLAFAFTVPENYTLIDSSTTTISFDPETYRNLTRFIFSNGSNILNFVFSNGYVGEENWNFVYRKEADHFLETMSTQKPNLKFRNNFSKLILGGQKFDKVHLIGKEGKEIKYNHVKLSKQYKGYQISISYIFTDDQTAATIESELQSVRFL